MLERCLEWGRHMNVHNDYTCQVTFSYFATFLYSIFLTGRERRVEITIPFRSCWFEWSTFSAVVVKLFDYFQLPTASTEVSLSALLHYYIYTCIYFPGLIKAGKKLLGEKKSQITSNLISDQEKKKKLFSHFKFGEDIGFSWNVLTISCLEWD